MEQKSFNLVEALGVAVQLEIKGRKFYLEVAEKTDNPTGKAVFTRLANEELVHLQTFQRMIQKDPELSKWRELNKEAPARPVIPLFDEKARASLKKATADELEALRIAMRQEKEAIDYFENLSQQADDEQSRSILLFVKEQEIYHYDLLMAEYDHIAQTGFWFDAAEFRMDGKA
jgi:rubrerythrin